MGSQVIVALALSTILAAPARSAEPFALSQVKLLEGPFRKANEVCANYLLEVEPDRLLASFRVHSGLQAKAKIYQGWENSGLAGHSLGHYLTACSQEYAASHDARFKQKVDYIVQELVACQKNRPDGYISAIPDGDKHWAEIKQGHIKSGGFDLNGMWSPWYTHHKVLAGLLDAYHLVGNKEALGVAKHFADWSIDETKDLTDTQWQQMLGCEYGGMNDALAELFAITKEEKYLTLSRKFYDHAVLDPLKAGEDKLPGRHSNTQIPKVIGLARLYELQGNPDDQKASRFFWDTIVNHHTYAFGGNSNHEYLGPADKLNDQLSSNTCETCNTYNMLKLTRHLFAWNPQASYFDFYERAQLNHILASQDPHGAGVTYFMPLGTGESRDYSSPWDNWTCCHGSGMENHTKYGDSIYFHDGNRRLYVNLFIASELNWGGRKVRLETNFPTDGRVLMTLTGKVGKFELAVRHPAWATGVVEMRVNGKVAATSNSPSSYIRLERTWKSGDKVEFTLPMNLHTEPMPDNPKRVALLYGPLVLAAKLGPENGPRPRVPVLVADAKEIGSWLHQTRPLEFRTQGTGRPDELSFVPFYKIDHERYGVYFDLFTEPQWQEAEQEYRAEEARQRDLEARTVDFMRVGEMQPERDHQLKSERNDVRDANGRSFRTAMTGGFMEATLKACGIKNNELVISYWGNERLKPEFDILVDGVKIATETLAGRKANVFYDVTYPIPASVTAGKSSVVVRIQPTAQHWSGSLCGLRVVRAH